MKKRTARMGDFAVAAGALALITTGSIAYADEAPQETSFTYEETDFSEREIKELNVPRETRQRIYEMLGDKATVPYDSINFDDRAIPFEFSRPMGTLDALRRSGVRMPDTFENYSPYDELDEAAEILNGQNPDFSIDNLNFLPNFGDGIRCTPYRFDGSTMCAKSIFNDRGSISVYYDTNEISEYTGDPSQYFSSQLLEDSAREGLYRKKTVETYGIRMRVEF
jgi:hypothetical protein